MPLYPLPGAVPRGESRGANLQAAHAPAGLTGGSQTEAATSPLPLHLVLPFHSHMHGFVGQWRRVQQQQCSGGHCVWAIYVLPSQGGESEAHMQRLPLQCCLRPVTSCTDPWRCGVVAVPCWLGGGALWASDEGCSVVVPTTCGPHTSHPAGWPGEGVGGLVCSWLHGPVATALQWWQGMAAVAGRVGAYMWRPLPLTCGAI